jgi:DNA-binding NarL/FixJ family response regulator
MHIPFYISEELPMRLQKCRLLNLRLTNAERFVLQLAFEDLTANQIAKQLGKSVHTIKTHRKRIRTKALEIYSPHNVSTTFVIAEMKIYHLLLQNAPEIKDFGHAESGTVCYDRHNQ